MMTRQNYYYNRMAGAWVIPDHWQMKLKKGDYYEIASECVSECIPSIYGEILESFRESGYYRVKAYSAWCPGGQEGKLPIVAPTRALTKQEFEYARTQRWQIIEADIR